MNSVRRVTRMLMVAILWLALPPAVGAQTASVSATAETTPVNGDADDPAIWIHPTVPSLSTIIGTDKTNGLAVYGLDGKQLQFIAGMHPDNVDLRYNFPLSGSPVDLVGFTDMADKTHKTIGFYKVNPETRLLEDVTARKIAAGRSAYGFCMYHSPVTQKYYAIVTSYVGDVQQWKLFDNGSGKVDARLVRTIKVGSITEGCVADDQYAHLYLAEENVGIWKYGAEPGDSTPRTMVDSTGSGGHLTADVEGLTIYYASNGSGYLIASSQGSSTFVVYTRGDPSGFNIYVKTFKIVTGNGIGKAKSTDGIDVVSRPLGPAFPHGLFVAHDGSKKFKLVPWEAIANAGTMPLTIDSAWDPRAH